MVMNDSRVQCDFCGVWIPLDMFRRGRAVVILKKKYCPACIREAVRDSRAKTAASRESIPPTAPPLPRPILPPPIAAPAPRKTRRVAVGEHGCGLYASEEERRAQLAPYLREGLEKRERVLHFLDPATPERILGDFREVGLPVRPFLDSGQLQILSAAKLLGTEATLDPLTVASKFAQASERAIAEGYSGLRIACEMTWALSSLIDTGRLIEFEIQLGSIVSGGRCSALCQYNVYRFEPSPLHHVRKNHAVILAKGTAEMVLRELAAVS
jgi:hypothetical protein